jgi:hypothetical protein
MLPFAWLQDGMKSLFSVQALNGSSYKWLLFGGADTVFFPEAVLQMLEDFDPQVPYIITDNLWWGGQHGGPNKGAPRCLPCHSADNRDLLDLTKGDSL